MSRAVWLFSLDCEQFTFLPLVTAGLKKYFMRHGRSPQRTTIDLVHFRYHSQAMKWLRTEWESDGLRRARESLACSERPVAAFSCYTWNMPTFLRMIARMKETCPDILIVAGGPQVQFIDHYVRGCGIDVIVLGEGERTFSDLLDAADDDAWPTIPGLAYVAAEGVVVRTAERPRLADLDAIPSHVDITPFADADGRPYKWAAYEAVRGCPFRCAYCQWGTGALGVSMKQLSIERVRHDLECIVRGGVEGILFCDSNFGALPDDMAKAECLIDIKRRFGRPIHFATCWSKTHNARVQAIARRLHENGLLEHYTMALQTLTPRALAMTNRTNMRNYKAAAEDMIRDGVPVVSELIWGLPGETLYEFQGNLDELTAVFPSHTIYPYAMLPGTELFDRREEYEIETVELAPYGRATAPYIISCSTFTRAEGLAGYLLITACILLYRGAIMPLTLRYLALRREVSMSRVLTAAFEELLRDFSERSTLMPGAGATEIFEKREFIYRWILANRADAFAALRRGVDRSLADAGYADWLPTISKLLGLDEALCPRKDGASEECVSFDFATKGVLESLNRMRLPDPELFATGEPHVWHVLHDWDFGLDRVPRPAPPAQRKLRARYPVWP
jgi:radical SAM superfamily enzyme YgiQ (UPF0313 family)